MLQHRKVVVEFPLMNGYSKPPRPRFPNKQNTVPWRPVEKRLKGNIVIEVNELPLQVPKYSFKIGTAKVDPNGQIIEIQPFLSVYNVHEAADLLREVGDKYLAIREEKQDEMDKNQRFSDEDDIGPRRQRT
jgi:hypothetical protein